MPDHKETGRQPTEPEREAAFAPHDSPERQPDGDPGEKRPRVIHEDDKANENDEGETAGDRGQWDNEPG